jgi:hypothetical protein
MAKQKKPSIVIEEISPTREISEIQLERLKAISRERLLTFEEVKILDLLHKNLLLDRGDATNAITVESRRLEEVKAMPDETLMQIAMTVDKDLINRSLETVDSDVEDSNKS